MNGHMFSLKGYREPTNRLPDWLPWYGLVAPGVVLQKAEVLQKTVAFRGPDLLASARPELITTVSRLNNALKRLGSGWSLFVEAQRLRSDNYAPSTWTHPAAWIVDYERRATFRTGTHFESNYYLTFAWQLPALAEHRAARLFSRTGPRRDGHTTATEDSVDARRDLGFFQKTIAEIVDILAAVFVEVRELNDEETLTYLHSTISTHRHPVRVPEIPIYLDALLPDQAFTPGDIPRLGRHYLPASTITGFPASTIPGILDQLNHLSLEYRWSTRYICLAKDDAQREFESIRRRFWQGRKSIVTLLKETITKEESALVDNASAGKAGEVDAALEELGHDIVSYGYLTSTIVVWDEDLDVARRKSQAVRQIIQQNGFVVRDESLNAQEAWLGSLPGHLWANVRRPPVSTTTLAHIMPLSSIWAGDRENSHLLERTGVGTAHVYCSTAGSTPFRLNLAVQDVGHTFIVGPTGAGKSTLLGTLAIQFLRYPRAQVIIIDKDRSARALTLALEGVIYEPGDERAATSFQPLRNIDDQVERVWASQFIELLLAQQKVVLSPELKEYVDSALASLASNPPEHRTISGLSFLLTPDLKAALYPYTVRGNYGQVFDAAHDSVDNTSSWQMFEMGALMRMGEEVVAPALDYVFHRVEARFDGRPTLLILDEAWLFLKHPIFVKRLQDWLKTLRKRNVYVVFATQDVADAANSPIAHTIVQACPTKIYLPDEQANTPALATIYKSFGLTDTEISLLAQATKKSDYYYKSVKGQRLFRLDLTPLALAFVGMSSPSDQRFLDDLERTTPPAQRAEKIVAYRQLDWAIPLLEQARATLTAGRPLTS
jgi:type IV secretion/conjugal transfer VirB4 family ATPase